MGPFLIGKSLVLFHKDRNINISIATKKNKILFTMRTEYSNLYTHGRLGVAKR